ncbi:MAG: hypothetical protein M3O70_26370 [Actinomycetota bacterium]|nr:hypothetical protein [Actinomycetota bacterium]
MGPQPACSLPLHTNRFTFVASPHLLSEVSRVLARERFRGHVILDEAREFVSQLHARAELFDDPVEVPAVSCDPDDD